MAEYDGRTALVVVDVENDFADPAGSLYVAGGEDVVPFVNAEIAAAQTAGALVVYTQDWHPPHTPHFVKDGGIWPDHCVAGTWGAEFHPDLRIEGEVIRKGTGGEDGYSGFSMRDPETGEVTSTGMAELLRARSAERVVVAGIATDYCVVESVVDAAGAGFAVEVLADGIRAVNLQPGDAARAVVRMVGAGRDHPMTAWVGDDNSALLTDFYEITMAAAYHATGAEAPATFDLFVRSLPETRRFLVAAGLDDVLDFLEGWHFSPESIEYLRSLGRFERSFLDYLADIRFTGEVRAVPEGEVVFNGEPLLEVTAPLPEAQLIETFLLNTVGFQTMIASKASRVALAAGERSFVDFSPRRDHGADAALKGARASYIGGAAATSMTLAGQAYGIPVTGTMAHSFVMSYREEADAFRDFARQFPDNATLLIDTYDTESGARVAVRVARELEAEGIRITGVRLDSGDLVRLSREVRAILDGSGFPHVQIFASGDLDEYRIAEMVATDSAVDAFGVGTRLGTSTDAPYLGVVYKLVEDDGQPVIKLSPGKVTLPGRKQVWRLDDRDVIGLADEDHSGRALLRPVLTGGKRLEPRASLDDLRTRRAEAVAALPHRLKTLTGSESPWSVELSPELMALHTRLGG